MVWLPDSVESMHHFLNAEVLDPMVGLVDIINFMNIITAVGVSTMSKSRSSVNLAKKKVFPPITTFDRVNGVYET